MRIGMMDSGLGGLTVVRELNERIKGNEIFYYADQKNCPYGEKTNKEIENAVQEVVDFLIKKEIEMLVIACNTATAVVLEKLKKELKIPVIGVINGGIEMAIEKTKNEKIAVFATQKTIEINKYEEGIKEKIKAEVFNYKCVEFVPYIEKDDNEGFEKEAKKYIKEAVKNNVDTIILGCTHYPLKQKILERIIKEEGKEEVELVNPAIRVVDYIESFLKINGELEKQEENMIKYYTNGDETEYKYSVRKIMKKKEEAIK